MLRSQLSFATCKPRLWRQKNKNQDQHAKQIPLPGVPGVIPEKDLFQKTAQRRGSIQ